MKFIKTSVASITMSLSFIVIPAKAQIPVTDVASLTQQVMQYASMVQDYYAQYQHYMQLINQVKAITDIRDIKQLLGMQEIKDAFSPEDFATLERLAGDFGAFENAANDRNMAALKKASNIAVQRLATIKDYERKAGQTMDEKEASALNAKLMAEVLKLQNESINFNTMQNMAKAKEQQIADKQREELFKFYMGKNKNTMIDVKE